MMIHKTGSLAGFGDGGRPKFRLSDQSVDRDGDVVLVKGWDLSEFKMNPLLLFMHDARSAPVGTVSKIWTEEDGLYIEPEFADTEKGREMKALVEGGHLRAVSAGFLIDEIENDKDMREKFGVKGHGMLITKARLFEASLVTIPANKNALRVACAEGLLSKSTFKEMFPDDGRDDKIADLESRIKMLEVAVGAPSEPKHENNENQIESVLRGVAMARIRRVVSGA